MDMKNTNRSKNIISEPLNNTGFTADKLHIQRTKWDSDKWFIINLKDRDIDLLDAGLAN